MDALRVNVTRDCNTNCSYCYMTNKEVYISEEEFNSLLTKWNPKKVSLSGGEPLLHPKLHKFILYAALKEASVNIVTNGTLIAKNEYSLSKLAEDLGKKKDQLKFSISIDGETKYNLESFSILKKYGIKTQVYIYPLLQKIDQIVNLLSQVSDCIDSCQLLFPMPMGKDSSYIGSKEWKSIVKEYNKVCNNAGVKLFFQMGYSSLVNDITIIPQEKLSSIFVDCDGSAHECCLVAEAAEIGYKIPYQSCKVHENQGCLALLSIYGEDYRLKEDFNAPCPLTVIDSLYMSID